MKKIIAVIIMVIGIVVNANAIEISSDEAFRIKKSVSKSFNPYGLHVVGADIKTRSNKVFLRFCLSNENANFYVLSHRDTENRLKYEEEGTDFVLKNEDGQFKKIHKGFKKGFFSEKETFMEIEDYYQKLPTWGLVCYEMEVEILTSQNIYLTVFSSSGRDYPKEFLFDLEYLIKREEQQTVFQLEDNIKKILGGE